MMKPDSTISQATVRTLLRINQLCDEFEAEYRCGKNPRIEAFVDGSSLDAIRILEQLIPIEIAYPQRRGERVSREEFASRFPQLDHTRLSHLFHTVGDAPIPPVLGEYEIVRSIGAGGMGTVYLARHRRMNRFVTLKTITRNTTDRALLLRRFTREIEITALLSHPNVVVAFDAREDQGISYLVTGYLEGGDLGGLVKLAGPLPIDSALRYVREAALDLAHAHWHGVIHRDVKPSNLLFDGSDRVCVADWGLARWKAGAAAKKAELTALWR